MTISSTNNLQLLKTHSSVSSRIKRSIDILGSLVEWGITGVLLIPILIAIALDSPGAIFSKQTRCRWIKKCFRIIKIYAIYRRRSRKTQNF
ncbi:MAG: hypothetical protein ACP8RL_00290 [cyanobacterium endosymbiont of Rhopalodia inflata]